MIQHFPFSSLLSYLAGIAVIHRWLSPVPYHLFSSIESYQHLSDLYHLDSIYQ